MDSVGHESRGWIARVEPGQPPERDAVGTHGPRMASRRAWYEARATVSFGRGPCRAGFNPAEHPGDRA